MANNNNIRRFVGAGLILAVLALSVYIVLRQRQAGSERAEPQQAPRAEVTVKGVRFTEEKGGRNVVDLTAATGDFDRTRNVTRLSGVRVAFAGERPKDGLVLTANDAEYDNASRDVRLSGSVRAKGTNGAEFRSERLEYSAARGTIRTADRVTLVDENLRVEGVGLECTVQGRDVRIMKDVTAQIGPKGKR